jgi:peptidoglycan/xylan/chitin deacetylase (PgdA/CDA1 family)
MVLLYHRVGVLGTDPQLLAVSPDRFAAQMAYLAQHWEVIPLRNLADGTAPPVDRSAVVTFDDGYEDNFVTAAPILQRYRVPATVFVASGCVGANREFWWDELERMFLEPSDLPPYLGVCVDGWRYELALHESRRYTGDDFDRHRGWTVLDKIDPTPRHTAYRELCRALRPMPAGLRAELLSQLRNWSGMEAEGRQTHRGLSVDQLTCLAADGSIDVGAHSVSHAALSTLSLEDQRTEIVKSRSQLEAWTGKSVSAFAYPYGTKGDYTDETASLVREAGFSLACANVPGVATVADDRFQLPRLIVRDWDEQRFARTLDRWFNGLAEEAA